MELNQANEIIRNFHKKLCGYTLEELTEAIDFIAQDKPSFAEFILDWIKDCSIEKDGKLYLNV